MISSDQIKELAKRYAIDEFTVIREFIQIVFLSALYSVKESRKIYFKGGTAIHLLLKTNRFSEDLDFTAKLTIKELDAVLKTVLKRLSLIIPNISLKKIDTGNKSYAGILSYKPQGAKYALNLHLEFSIREKPETSEEHVLLNDFPVSSQPIIRHLSWTEIMAEKIRAFMLRSKGRDMYDIWFMLSKGVEPDWAMVNRKMKFYKTKLTVKDIMHKISTFSDKQIKDDLQKFLPAYDRKLVANLKELTLKQISSR